MSISTRPSLRPVSPLLVEGFGELLLRDQLALEQQLAEPDALAGHELRS